MHRVAFSGFLCILCGFIILIMDLLLPEMIANFFGVDVRQDNDQIQREGKSKKLNIIFYNCFSYFVPHKFGVWPEKKLLELDNIVIVIYVSLHKF